MRSRLREAFETMHIRRKIKSRSGFSLAETLVAIIILLLVSAIVAEGIPVAKNAYEKVVYAANAKVMLSTAITALRNEFATAQRIAPLDEDTTSITYYSADRGADSRIYVYPNTGTDDKYKANTVMLQEYQDYGNLAEGDSSFFGIINPDWKAAEGVTVPPRELIASLEAQRGRKDKLYVCCSGFHYDAAKKLVTVSELRVCHSTDDKILAQIGDEETPGDLIIRVIPNDAIFAGT